MRKLAFVFLTMTAACTGQPNFFGAPLQINTNSQTRGQVELFVKSNHPALIADIQRGAGNTLTEAYNIAGVPENNRDVQTLRLQSNLALYSANPGALIIALTTIAG